MPTTLGAPIHQSIFDDRFEVENPGLLPFALTVDDLRHGVTKLRCRVIGGVFHEPSRNLHGVGRSVLSCCGLAAQKGDGKELLPYALTVTRNWPLIEPQALRTLVNSRR